MNRSNQPSSERRWYRFHVSSVMLALPLLIVYLVISYPCHHYRTAFMGGYEAAGWPLVHYMDSFDEGEIEQQLDGRQIVWTENLPFKEKHFFPKIKETWYGSSEADEFVKVLWLGLLVNFTIGAGIFWLVAIPLEWRRRYRNSFWQLTLSDIMIVFVLVCSALATYLYVRNVAAAHARVEHMIEAEFGVRVTYKPQHHRRDYPTWVSHLTFGNHDALRCRIRLGNGDAVSIPLIQRIEHVQAYRYDETVCPRTGNSYDLDEQLSLLDLSSAVSLSKASHARLEKLAQADGSKIRFLQIVLDEAVRNQSGLAPIRPNDFINLYILKISSHDFKSLGLASTIYEHLEYVDLYELPDKQLADWLSQQPKLRRLFVFTKADPAQVQTLFPKKKCVASGRGVLIKMREPTDN